MFEFNTIEEALEDLRRLQLRMVGLYLISLAAEELA